MAVRGGVFAGGRRCVPTDKAAGFTPLVTVEEYTLSAQMTVGSPVALSSAAPNGQSWTFMDRTNAAGTAPHRFTMDGGKLIYPGGGVAGAATFDMTIATIVIKMDASGNAWVL